MVLGHNVLFVFVFVVLCFVYSLVYIILGRTQFSDVGLSVLKRFLNPNSIRTKKPAEGKASKLAKRVIACLDVRTNNKGDFVVTKGDQFDVRENTKENEDTRG